MCGIVGYVGPKEAAPILLEGLRRLEYRGYDSAGVAVYSPGTNGSSPFQIHRCKGKLVNLIERVGQSPLKGHLGLGHTRWATHGAPSETNAHPHWSERVVVVHNGIVENYVGIKEMLQRQGAKFTSQTDTEVIPHLIELYWKQSGDLEASFRRAVSELHGSFALAMFARDNPQTLYASRLRVPLIVGLGKGENFLASDITAVLEHTRDMIILEDGDFAVISPTGVRLTDVKGKAIERPVRQVTWTAAMAQKEGYPHFMLKEIHEQPRAIAQTLQGRINQASGKITLDEIGLPEKLLKDTQRITIVACGTSWHAGLAGKYIFEALARIPVDVDLASEFRYRQPVINKDTLVIAISQSGETADTMAALVEAKEHNVPVLSICNVIDSSIPRACKYNFYTHAGPEIGVASTKAFTTQLIALNLLALYFGSSRGLISDAQMRAYIDDLVQLPGKLEDLLKGEDEIKNLAQRFYKYQDFLYLGRGLSYPIALEGALKLKEISYMHAEGYPAGEIKHGPIALIDENMPVLVIGAGDATFEKTLSNLSEVKTRGGVTILCLTEEQKKRISKVPGVDHTIITPDSNPYLLPVLQSIPLQLLAYHIAVLRGTDVDQPRNLAKSVTVE